MILLQQDEESKKVQISVSEAIHALTKGAQRVDFSTDTNTQLNPIIPFKVTGYWVGDLLRIDIKWKGEK